MGVASTICVESETAGDPGTMFRVLADGELLGANLTAVQAHLLLGEILERVAFPVRHQNLSCESSSSKNVRSTANRDRQRI